MDQIRPFAITSVITQRSSLEIHLLPRNPVYNSMEAPHLPHQGVKADLIMLALPLLPHHHHMAMKMKILPLIELLHLIHRLPLQLVALQQSHLIHRFPHTILNLN